MKKQISIIVFLAQWAILMAQQAGTDTLYFTLNQAVLFAMENNMNVLLIDLGKTFSVFE